MNIPQRKWALAFLLALTITLMALSSIVTYSASMPGRSYGGPMLPLSEAEREVAAGMRKHVGMLAGTIGERNMQKLDKLNAAASYIENEFSKMGYNVKSQEYVATDKETSKFKERSPIYFSNVAVRLQVIF